MSDERLNINALGQRRADEGKGHALAGDSERAERRSDHHRCAVYPTQARLSRDLQESTASPRFNGPGLSGPGVVTSVRRAQVSQLVIRSDPCACMAVDHGFAADALPLLFPSSLARACRQG